MKLKEKWLALLSPEKRKSAFLSFKKGKLVLPPLKKGKLTLPPLKKGKLTLPALKKGKLTLPALKNRIPAKCSFKKKITVYVSVFVLMLVALWMLTWQYAVCYEAAQPAGAMNSYLESNLLPELEQQIGEISETYANKYQSAEEISDVLLEQVQNGKWIFKEDSSASTDTEPVYHMFCDGTKLASVRLTPGTAPWINFGYTPWEVTEPEVDAMAMAKTVKIVTPQNSGVKLNGASLSKSAADSETRKQYPDFDDYGAQITIDMELQTYTTENLFTEATVTADKGFAVINAEEGVYYVAPVCDKETEQELMKFAEGFVTTYIRYTSNAADIYEVQRYVHLRSEMYQRLYKSVDGMSWVSGVTGELASLKLHDLVYYGNTATVEADYELDMKKIDDYSGSMHIVLAKGSYNWRVVYMEQY